MSAVAILAQAMAAFVQHRKLVRSGDRVSAMVFGRTNAHLLHVAE